MFQTRAKCHKKRKKCPWTLTNKLCFRDYLQTDHLAHHFFRCFIFQVKFSSIFI